MQNLMQQQGKHNGVGKSDKTNPENVTGLGLILRALYHRNYRLFFSGQSISLIGTWMQRIAVRWLVYRLTNSAFLLGVVGFAGQIPIFFLTPLAGVLADRLNRRRIRVVTQTLAMIQALILAVLVLTGTVAVWQDRCSQYSNDRRSLLYFRFALVR